MVAVLACLVSSLRRLVMVGEGLPGGLSSGGQVRFKHILDIPFPHTLHKRLEADFIDQFEEVLVIGDVHGCYDEMLKLIRSVNEGEYMNSKILKVFVGDLVNKGPKSKQVVDYMMAHETDCLSVRGNHDETVIKQYLMYKSDPTALLEKNAWMKELTDPEITYLISLPYTISIPSLNVIMVHAGLVPGRDLEDTNPKHLVSMRNLVSQSETSDSLKPTKNDKEGKAWASLFSGPEHVYFGHDAKRMLQKHSHATGLDTGCVYGKMLSAVFIKGPRKNSFVHVNAATVYQIPTGND